MLTYEAIGIYRLPHAVLKTADVLKKLRKQIQPAVSGVNIIVDFFCKL